MSDMNFKSLKPKERFSSRTEAYVTYRPGYPEEIVGYLEKKISLCKNKVIADIGSGTGKLSQLFMRNGYKVYAVEPNREMRRAAEKLFNSDFIERAVFDYKQEFDFKGLKGRLESTSYCPLPGSDNHTVMMTKLRRLFDNHAINNNVKFEYKTEVYTIRLS